MAEEFKQLDANKQQPANPTAAASASSGNPELDRRRMIYKNIRKEINENEQVAKQKAYSEKMSALEAKMQQKDLERRAQQEQASLEAAAAEKRRKEALNKNKNFLDNLEAFNVE